MDHHGQGLRHASGTTTSWLASPARMPTKSMPITGNPEADQLLIDQPLAVVIGMLLDPHIGEVSTRHAGSGDRPREPVEDVALVAPR